MRPGVEPLVHEHGNTPPRHVFDVGEHATRARYLELDGHDLTAPERIGEAATELEPRSAPRRKGSAGRKNVRSVIDHEVVEGRLDDRPRTRVPSRELEASQVRRDDERA